MVAKTIFLFYLSTSTNISEVKRINLQYKKFAKASDVLSDTLGCMCLRQIIAYEEAHSAVSREELDNEAGLYSDNGFRVTTFKDISCVLLIVMMNYRNVCFSERKCCFTMDHLSTVALCGCASVKKRKHPL